MSFKDTIVAGVSLIRSAIQSPNFVSALTGWRIKQDGTAEFNSLIARGDITVGNKSLSLIKALTALAASGNSQTVVESAQNTTASETVAVPALGLWQGMAVYVNNWAADLDPATIFDVVITASFDFQSTSSTGSGGHFNAFYYHTDNTVDPYLAEMREGNDGGKHSLTMSWSDTVTRAFLNNIVGSQRQGSITMKHTGSTAYNLVWTSIALSWKARVA